MGDYEYNSVGISDVEAVELVDEEVTPTKVGTDSGGEARSKSKKEQLIDLLPEPFEEFEVEFREILDTFSYSRGFNWDVLELLDVPNYLCCQNCRQLKYSSGGEAYCNAASSYTEIRNGEFEPISDIGSIPEHCPVDDSRFQYPKERIGEVNSTLIESISTEYPSYVERKERKGHNQILGEQDFIVRQLSRLLNGLLLSTQLGKFRNHAKKAAWHLNVTPNTELEYWPAKAEAYLRALESSEAREHSRGEGGIEFERSVRGYIEELGWPLNDSALRVMGDVSMNYKEMDIHTEFCERPTVIETFTSGAHSKKNEQLSDYIELLEMATGETARGVLLSDHIRPALTSEFLSSLLRYTGRTPEWFPGDDSVSVENGSVSLRGHVRKEGEASLQRYDFQDFSYELEADVRTYEEHAEDILSRHGLEVRKPYGTQTTVGRNKARVKCFPLGPTVEIEDSEGAHTIVFTARSGWEWEERQIREYSKTTEESKLVKVTANKVRSGNWPYWLKNVEDHQEVTVVDLLHPSARSNTQVPEKLSVHLLHTLLSYKPPAHTG